MPLAVISSRHLDVTVFEFEGRITLGEGSVLLRHTVRDALLNGYKKFAFDFGRVLYQDSSSLGELIDAHVLIKNSGGSLVLFNLSWKSRDALNSGKLLTVFEVFGSLEEALGYFDSRRKLAFNVTARHDNGISILGVEGALTCNTYHSELTPASLKLGTTSAIILCPQLLDIDLFGAQELISLKQSIRKLGGDLVLAGIEPWLMPKVLATNMLGEIANFETLDLAFKAFAFPLT